MTKQHYIDEALILVDTTLRKYNVFIELPFEMLLFSGATQKEVEETYNQIKTTLKTFKASTPNFGSFVIQAINGLYSEAIEARKKHEEAQKVCL